MANRGPLLVLTPHVLNLANSVVGVSLLALPFVMVKVGVLIGVLLTGLVYWLCRISCNFILEAANKTHKTSYERLALALLGPAGKLTVELSMLWYAYWYCGHLPAHCLKHVHHFPLFRQQLGTCVAFLGILGDILPTLLEEAGMVQSAAESRVTVMVTVAMVIVWPLCLLRDVDRIASLVCHHATESSWYKEISAFRPVALAHLVDFHHFLHRVRDRAW